MYYIDTDELEDDTKVQCPKCAANGGDKSQDNFHYFSKEDGGYCFKCSFTIPSEEYKEESNKNLKAKGNAQMITSKDIDNLKNKALTAEQVAEIEAKTFTDIPKPYRGVPSEVYKSLGVRWEKNGKEVSMYYPITVVEDGNERVVGYKIRKHPKEFYSVGYVGKLGGFLNQSNAVADTLIICSGEIDLASAIYGLELDKYRKSYNVVSSSLGEDSTATMIKLNYDWVNAHKKIVACMDNDEAGEKAFEKIKEVIDADKLYKANLKYNDLNDMLKNNAANEIANAIYWSPIPTIDFGIAGSGSIYNSMVELAKKEKVRLPAFLNDLNDLLAGGVGVAELILLVSPPSVGKSSVVNQWILDWLINSPYKLFIVSIEDSKASFGLKIASKITSINIMGLETVEEKLKVLDDNKEEIDQYLYDADGSDRFSILEKIPSEIEDLKKAILQAVIVHGCKIVVVDPLSALLASLSNEQQVDLMAFFEGLKRDYEIIGILCLHTRKSGSGQKDISEGADYGESDIRGSSSISGTGTITIMLSRDKYAEDEIERNTTNISVPKNRSASKTGRNVAKVYYSPEHSTLFSYEYAQTNNFFKDVTPEELKNILDDTKATPVVGNDDIDDVEIIDCF